MNDLKQQIMLLPRHELTQLAIWINSEEMPRREREEAKLEGMTELIEAMPDAPKQVKVDDVEQAVTPETLDGIPDWVDPHNDHMKMYLPNAIVRHKGKLWVSRLPRINEYEPSTTHPELNIWVEWVPPAPAEPVEPDEPADPTEPVEDTPAAPEWKQPTGAHDVYKQGDLVTYEGAVWESLTNGNSWSPTDYPQGWKKH